MRGPINVKSPNNITNWQMRFNSAFKGLIMPANKQITSSQVQFSPTNSTRVARPLHSVKKKPAPPARKYRAVDSHCASKELILLAIPEINLCVFKRPPLEQL
jgi:hypothetical protein